MSALAAEKPLSEHPALWSVLTMTWCPWRAWGEPTRSLQTISASATLSRLVPGELQARHSPVLEFKSLRAPRASFLAIELPSMTIFICLCYRTSMQSINQIEACRADALQVVQYIFSKKLILPVGCWTRAPQPWFICCSDPQSPALPYLLI